MELATFKQRIARAGVLVSPREWPLLSHFLAQEFAAAELLLQKDPAAEQLFATLEAHGMGGWLLNRLPDSCFADAAWRTRLQRGSDREFAACALRRHGLLQLDRACRDCLEPPLVIKGAANALLYYPRESLRPSHDIDLLLAPQDAERCFPQESQTVHAEEPSWGPHHHAVPFSVGGYTVELHHFLTAPDRWGRHEDLRAEAVPLPGFDRLHGPAPTLAATIALIHFNFHVGSFTYDFHDLDCIARHEHFDWRTAENYWRANGLVANVLPGLAVFAALGGPVPADGWDRLYAALPLRKRAEVALGLQLLSSPRFSRLRKDWFCTRVTGWPLLWPLAKRIAGSYALTREQTGRNESDPMFWMHHYLGLPARRLLSFWR